MYCVEAIMARALRRQGYGPAHLWSFTWLEQDREWILTGQAPGRRIAQLRYDPSGPQLEMVVYIPRASEEKWRRYVLPIAPRPRTAIHPN